MDVGPLVQVIHSSWTRVASTICLGNDNMVILGKHNFVIPFSLSILTPWISNNISSTYNNEAIESE